MIRKPSWCLTLPAFILTLVMGAWFPIAAAQAEAVGWAGVTLGMSKSEFNSKFENTPENPQHPEINVFSVNKPTSVDGLRAIIHVTFDSSDHIHSIRLDVTHGDKYDYMILLKDITTMHGAPVMVSSETANPDRENFAMWALGHGMRLEVTTAYGISVIFVDVRSLSDLP